jgi:type IV pilus assembly protein PilB
MPSLPSIQELLAKRAASSAANSSVPEKTPPTTNNTPQPPTPPATTIEDELAEKLEYIKQKEKETDTQRQAQALGLPTIALKGFPINAETLSLIPEEQSRTLKAIVFFFNGTEIRLGAVSPQDPKVEELFFSLTERYHANGKIYLISEESFTQAHRLYATLPTITPEVKGLEINESDIAVYQEKMDAGVGIGEILQQTNMSDIITAIVAAALKAGSSDIHIETEESGIVVRFRIDGLLQEVGRIPIEQWKKMINRIKLIASLKLNVTKEAQDGRFTIFEKDGKVDVRVSAIPTAFGESVVMRLLVPTTIGLAFENLGMRPAMLKKVQREIERPSGMIITTGPTGSGKTTTLYAILKKLNTPDVKIITLEDPIEYKVAGINQSQIDAHIDYTFSKGLRSMLRQDPDIVMVGEIRDLDTAEVAIQAALTGHLLLSTIHTNSAIGAIPRFLSMGVTPHLLAPALNAIIGQRLIRKLCNNCKTPYTPTPEESALIEKTIKNIPEKSGEPQPDLTKATFFAPKGCNNCNSGYKGRIGIYEVLIRDADLEKAILEKNMSEYAIEEIAKKQGMTSMLQDALLKCIEGSTSLDEVRRIVGL